MTTYYQCNWIVTPAPWIIHTIKKLDASICEVYFGITFQDSNGFLICPAILKIHQNHPLLDDLLNDTESIGLTNWIELSPDEFKQATASARNVTDEDGTVIGSEIDTIFSNGRRNEALKDKLDGLGQSYTYFSADWVYEKNQSLHLPEIYKSLTQKNILLYALTIFKNSQGLHSHEFGFRLPSHTEMDTVVDSLSDQFKLLNPRVISEDTFYSGYKLSYFFNVDFFARTAQTYVEKNAAILQNLNLSDEENNS
ncbi:MAG: hypothetical protein RLP44_31830 [Aggregatilineales bacterium]